MDPFTNTHFIGRVESTRKKLNYASRFHIIQIFSSKKTDVWIQITRIYIFSLALRDKGLTFFKK